MPNQAYMSAQRWFGMKKGAGSVGTSYTPTLFLPIDPNPSLEPKTTWLADKGLRESPVDQYGAVPGFRHDEFSWKGNMFADTFPALMSMALGGTDTPAGTVAPYTHAIKLLNDPTTGSQPPQYTIFDVDNYSQSWPNTTAASAKQMTGCQLSEVNVEFTAEGNVTYNAKLFGNPYTNVPADALSAIAFSSEIFIPAWDSSITATIGTVAQTFLPMKGNISIKRNVQPIYTLGNTITLGGNTIPVPYLLYAGPIQVSGKFTIVASPGDIIFQAALTSDPLTLGFTFTDPVSSHSCAFTMSKCQLQNPKVDSSKNWIEVPVDFVALANPTDAAGGLGYSPLSFTAVNGQSSAY